MIWNALSRAVEPVVTFLAGTALGSAVGFATVETAPWGAGPGAALVAGGMAAGAAWLLLGRIDPREKRKLGITLAELTIKDAVPEEASSSDAADILLLDETVPVAVPSPVLRLVPPPAAADAPPFAVPGEMVTRIADFLGQDRGAAARAAPAAASPDASAALHAALADIRRSLRQG